MTTPLQTRVNAQLFLIDLVVLHLISRFGLRPSDIFRESLCSSHAYGFIVIGTRFTDERNWKQAGETKKKVASLHEQSKPDFDSALLRSATELHTMLF